MFSDYAGAVGGDVGPWEAESGSTADFGVSLDLVKERVITAGRLATAFDDMASNNRSGELVEIVLAPSVVPCRRTTHNCCVGDSSGHHDVGAAVQCFDDAEAPQVRISAHILRQVAKIAALVERFKRASRCEILDPWQQIVAVDIGNGGRQAEFGGNFSYGISTSAWSQASGIGNDLNALVEARSHDFFHLLDEGTGVTAGWVLGLDSTQDEHRELGQPVTGQHIDGAAFDHLSST